MSLEDVVSEEDAHVSEVARSSGLMYGMLATGAAVLGGITGPLGLSLAACVGLGAGHYLGKKQALAAEEHDHGGEGDPHHDMIKNRYASIGAMALGAIGYVGAQMIFPGLGDALVMGGLGGVIGGCIAGYAYGGKRAKYLDG